MIKNFFIREKAVDLAILTDVVRQDQSSPSFEITEWSLKTLSHKGIINPDGLWFLSGEGFDREGLRPWSVVLKIVERPDEEPPLSNMGHWKRELLLVQSGLLQRIPGPVKAPIFYRVDETSDGAWLWMKYIDRHRANPWVLDDYAFAARQLGYWNGICIKEMALPTEPWLAKQHYRSWLSDFNPEEDWQFLLHQKYISDDIRNRCDRLWAERERFFSVLENLPQIFSHFDSQRRNLFIRKSEDDQDELISVDWAMCGLGPLEAELNSLIGMSSGLLEWSPTALPELDGAAFGSYLQGLHEAGWSGDADQVRLGYVAWLAVYFGCAIVPGLTAWWCTHENRPAALKAFGIAEEELFQQMLPLLDYSLNCADEARALMR